MSKVCLLHVSDLHISKIPNQSEIGRRSFFDKVRDIFNNHKHCASYGTMQLRALSKFIDTQIERLDVCLITGDISTTGFDFDLPYALQVVENLNKQVNVFLLPGNHDRYKLLFGSTSFLYAPGSKNFHRHFSKYWDDDVRENPVLETSDLAVCIISADFSLRRVRDADFRKSIGGFYAQGRVYPDVLEKLIEVTKGCFSKFRNEKDVAVIWAVHFPPFAPNIPAHSELIDPDNLLTKAAQENGVISILSGHLHYKFAEFKDGVYFLGTGTTTQIEERGNHCRILSIENENDDIWIEKEDYVFDKYISAFVRI